MKCEFKYIKVKQSGHVEEHCLQLLSKLEKHLDRPLKGCFTFSKQDFEHKAVLTLKGKNMFFKSESTDENFYAAIESAVDKLCRQLDKKKSKMKNHKHKTSAKELNNVIYIEDYRKMLELRRKIG